MVPKNLSLKLRIRFVHNQDTILKNQKFGKMVSPSRMHVQSIDGKSYYLSNSPLIDFPFNMKTMEGKFDSKTTMYLSHVHTNALKSTLKAMLRGMMRQDLFYLVNNALQINEEISEREKQVLPIRGVIIELRYGIIREMTGNNEYSAYEGIRIINQTNQTMAELTVDEISSFIDILDSLKPAQLAIAATQLGLDLIKTPNEIFNALHIPREQIVSS